MKRLLLIAFAISSSVMAMENNSLLERAYDLCNYVGMTQRGHLHVADCMYKMDEYVEKNGNASVDEMVNAQCDMWPDMYYGVDTNVCLEIARKNGFI